MIAITGASSGLGAALAKEYAAPGVSLALAARRTGMLHDVAEVCEGQGARVICRQLDITDTEDIALWVEEIEQVAPVELMLVNAGVFSGHGPDGQMETTQDLARLIETNLIGAAATLNAIASRMQNRQSGHIALISSLAALQPLADAPAYSAAKAGIRAYAESMREYLAKDKITVSVILPGHMKTAQTAVHVGSLTGIISCEEAAAIIRKGLDRRRCYIAFPRDMHVLVRLGRLLPWRLRAWTNRPNRFHVKPAADSGLRKQQSAEKEPI